MGSAGDAVGRPSTQPGGHCPMCPISSQRDYYLRIVSIYSLAAGLVWVLSAIILGASSVEYSNTSNYNCWTCLSNCVGTGSDVRQYCKGSPGEVGYDVGLVNSIIFLVLGAASLVTAAWMFYSILKSPRLRATILTALLACMAFADFIYALQFVGFAIDKISTSEYPYEPSPTFCKAFGVLSHVSLVGSVIFYIGFSVTLGIMIWIPFKFKKLVSVSRTKYQYIGVWIALAIVYTVPIAIYAVVSDRIGVTVDGSCWVEGELEWTFHVLLYLAMIYSFVLFLQLVLHRIEMAQRMGRKYAVFLMAFLLCNVFFTIFTLTYITETRPQSTGWAYALLETVTVMLQVGQGLIFGLVYFYKLRIDNLAKETSSVVGSDNPSHKMIPNQADIGNGIDADTGTGTDTGTNTANAESLMIDKV